MGRWNPARGILRPAAGAGPLHRYARNGKLSLINSVLDLERIETGLHGFEFAATRASDLLTRALEANQTYAMRLSVALHIEPPPSEVLVWTDPVRAQQILTNLISNAVKFSSEGEDVALGCEPQSDRVRLYVSDHGSGIPEDARERIFQRFPGLQPGYSRSPAAARAVDPRPRHPARQRHRLRPSRARLGVL